MSKSDIRIINDLIILGRATPEELSDGRQTICAAEFSEEFGLVRLYPTRWDMQLNRWNKVSVPVEKPVRPQYDYRDESWKIHGSRSEWDRLSDKIKPSGTLKKRSDRISLVQSLGSGCTSNLWPDGKSLGVIKPTIERFYFEENPRKKNVRQQSLDGSFRMMVKDDFDYIPRVQYRCSDCKAKGPHNQQILEWGFYEGMRKNPNDINKVWDNVGFSSMDEWDFYFLVGNLYTKPKAFNVICVFRWKK